MVSRWFFDLGLEPEIAADLGAEPVKDNASACALSHVSVGLGLDDS